MAMTTANSAELLGKFKSYLNTVKAKEAHTGVMVAFMLPAKIAAKLALSAKDLPGGVTPEPAEGLHITLAYLGKTTDLAHAKLAVIQCLADMARYSVPITGVVSGVGLFNVSDSSDGKQPFYASFSSPSLASFRQALVSALGSHGVMPASNHGFTPHITLAYLPEGTPLPVITLPGLEITFDGMVLAWGDEQTIFPFPNPSAQATARFANPVVALKEYLAKTHKAIEPDVGGGVNRDKLGAKDFAIPSERKFPVVIPQDVKDAVSSWGRYKGPVTFEQFKASLSRLAGRKGKAFVDALPAAWGMQSPETTLKEFSGISLKEATTDDLIWLVTTYKHGTHDQSTHGRRLLGGRVKKLTGRVASLDPVKAKKHVAMALLRDPKSTPAQNRAAKRVLSKEEIIAAIAKRRGGVNGKVIGSNPSKAILANLKKKFNLPQKEIDGLSALEGDSGLNLDDEGLGLSVGLPSQQNPTTGLWRAGRDWFKTEDEAEKYQLKRNLDRWKINAEKAKTAKVNQALQEKLKPEMVGFLKENNWKLEKYSSTNAGRADPGPAYRLIDAKNNKEIARDIGFGDFNYSDGNDQVAAYAQLKQDRPDLFSAEAKPQRERAQPEIKKPSQADILDAASDALFNELLPRDPKEDGEGKDRKPLTDEDVRQATIDAMLRAQTDKFSQPKTGGRIPRRQLTPEQKREFAKLVADAERELARDSKVTPMPDGKPDEPDLPDFVTPDGDDVFLKNKTYTLRGEQFSVEPPKTDEDRRRLGWVSLNHPNDSLRLDAKKMLELDKKYAPPPPKPKPLPSASEYPLPVELKNSIHEGPGGVIKSIEKNGVRISYWQSNDGGVRRAYIDKATGFKNRPYEKVSKDNYIDLNNPEDTDYEQYLAQLGIDHRVLRANMGRPYLKPAPATTKAWDLQQAFIETLKHGTHNQKTHGRRHLGGRVDDLIKRGIGKVEARRMAAVGALNDPNASREERTAAKRIVPRVDRPNLTTSNKPSSKKPNLPLSKGTVAVLGDFEYFKDDKGNLYRAPKNNPIDTKGYRSGGRLEATPATADKAMELAQAANAKFNPPEVKPARTPVSRAVKPKPAGSSKTALTKAFGSDPNRTYEFRNRVVDLDDMITSNNDNGTVNPAYTQELQPRLREREASKRQVDKIAKTFVPESALWDFHQLDKGPAIIGSDGMVESGNGRTLAMRKMRQEYPEKWAEYQAKLKESLDQAGLSEADLKGIKNPVLVRERVSNVDRAAFAKEANSPPVLQMSALEQALVDSKMVSDASLERFEVADDQTIDQALRSQKNKGFVSNFVGMLSDAERAPLMRGDGSLSQQGLWRIKAALFTKLFPGEAGTRLADTFLESLDSTVKNFESGISSSMPKLARADGLINSGQRNRTLSITDDLSKAIDMLARLKENGPEVKKYLNQSSMFDRELTSFQESLLAYFDDIGRSPKKIKEFMQGYADAVINAQDLNQVSMFGDMGDGPTKESIVMRLIGRSVGEPALAMKAAGNGKRSIPKLKKKGIVPAPDSLAAALYGPDLLPKETLADVEAQKRLKEFLQKVVNPDAGQEKEATFTVFKEAKTGQYRWLLRTSTAFKDRDRQILSIQGLKEAVARMDETGKYGPLRWWHVPGLDIGDCDFSIVVGKSLIESGTFRHPVFAESFKGVALEASPGFRHPATEPDKDDVFNNFAIFERSLLPQGRASNLFTRLGLVNA